MLSISPTLPLVAIFSLLVFLGVAERPPEEASAVTRVAVAFMDDITEGQARAFIRRSGYEVLDVRFSPVIVWAATDEPLSDEQMGRLLRLRGVVSVEQEDAGARRAVLNSTLTQKESITFKPLSVTDPLFTSVSVSYHNVTLVLEPWMSRRAAEHLLRGVTDAYVRKVTKWPNTITIRINGTWGSDAVRWLESQAEVAGVTFETAR